MRSNIIIEKIWEDDGFFLAHIKCSSSAVTAESDVYISNENLCDLYRKITALEDNDTDSVYWESGNKGDNSTPCISFSFFKVDKNGHFRIEVFMEIDDGGKLSKHTCCFYVETETQLLFDFANKLPRMINNESGYKVELVNKETLL